MNELIGRGEKLLAVAPVPVRVFAAGVLFGAAIVLLAVALLVDGRGE